MNSQIRKLGVTLIIMFCLLLGQLTRIQIVDAKQLQNNPRNGRIIVKNFNAPRGAIQTADGVVVATSVNKKQGRFERQRTYPEGDLYSQLTGFYSFRYGSTGIESSYDADLRGKSHSTINNVLRPFTDSSYTEDLTMTVNSNMQKIARNALGKRKGAVVALNPQDGSILAMWSYPSYDPSPLTDYDPSVEQKFWDAHKSDADKTMLARAYAERYPPGSTFKTITASAALDFQPDLATKSYPSESSFILPGTKTPLSNFSHETCGGQMAVLLKVSCNTGFAHIGIDLGAKKLYNQAVNFGFDVDSKQQPLDISGVVPSVFPSPDVFTHDVAGVAQSAIGQASVTATPLEMALVAAGIGNSGNIMKPHLMKELRDSNGQVVRTYRPQVWRQAMSGDAAGKLRDMMVGVVAGGTGTRAQISGVTVAGKTGTAQSVLPGHAHAWFISFAPAQNPTIAVAVILESQVGVSENATGGTFAAPIAKQIMQAALAQTPSPTP